MVDETSQSDDADFPLPKLSPLMKLYKGPERSDGSASWTLHHPLSNKYYQIEWAEFECLSRMPGCKTAQELISVINKNTTIRIDLSDIRNILIMLHQAGLLEGNVTTAQKQEKPEQPLWKTLLHNYLFFSVPLFKPERFLNMAYPYIRPLFSRGFLFITGALFLILLAMTLQRWDEFTHTFINLISPEGAVLAFITLMGVKVLHELGHGFMAYRYGVKVPHMGVAFMVMYPVFYTETSAAWTVQSRKARMHIGLAGVITELILSTYALLLWHISGPGILQSLAFSVLALSLIRSLAINLNPFMRFDGYFIFSDWLGIENLHARSFACARWWIVRILWGLDDPPPEDTNNQARLQFLTLFGLAMIVYRFFLFMGIALLVYWMFFKPLGFILMMVELCWFIALPVWREMCQWWKKREAIRGQPRARFVLGATAACLIFLSLPVHQSLSVPAIAQAAERRAFYPPENSFVEDIGVHEGQAVRAGDILMVLASPQLERDVKLAEAHVDRLKALRRALVSATEEERQKTPVTEEEIEAAQQKLADLKQKQALLTLTAPFDGAVLSFNTDLRPGLAIPKTTLLFNVISPGRVAVSGYVREESLPRIAAGQSAFFRPDYAVMDGFSLEVDHIDPVNAASITWPELSSVYHGPLLSDWDREAGLIKPRESLTLVGFETPPGSAPSMPMATRGHVEISARAASPLMDLIRTGASLVMREIGLN